MEKWILCVLLLGCGGAGMMEPVFEDASMEDGGIGGPIGMRPVVEVDSSAPALDDAHVDVEEEDTATEWPYPGFSKRNGVACKHDDECAQGFGEDQALRGWCVNGVCSACSTDKQDECIGTCAEGPVEGVPCSTIGGNASQCGYCVDAPEVWPWPDGCPTGAEAATNCIPKDVVCDGRPDGTPCGEPRCDGPEIRDPAQQRHSCIGHDFVCASGRCKEVIIDCCSDESITRCCPNNDPTCIGFCAVYVDDALYRSGCVVAWYTPDAQGGICE